MFTPHNHVKAPLVQTCDHCSKKVTVLWQDNERWLLCPECWPMYHIPSKTREKLIQKYIGDKNEIHCTC